LTGGIELESIMATLKTATKAGFADGLYHLACWGLAGLFIFSGLTKLVDPVQFAVLIDAYGLLPEILVLPMAVVLPALEVAAGVSLVLNIRGSLTVITLLLVLFMAVLGYGIWIGLDVDCGCFGPEDPEARAFHGLRQAMYRDIAILAVVVGMYFWRYRRAERPVQFQNII
jgi:hypothetical protein